MSEHPAVAAHWNLSAKFSEDAEPHNVPNHAELTPHLASLPEDLTYSIVDTEGNDESETLEDLGYRELPETETKWDDDRGYGGCIKIAARGGKIVGLTVYLNGSPGQSAPGYTICSLPPGFVTLREWNRTNEENQVSSIVWNYIRVRNVGVEVSLISPDLSEYTARESFIAARVYSTEYTEITEYLDSKYLPCVLKVVSHMPHTPSVPVWIQLKRVED